MIDPPTKSGIRNQESGIRNHLSITIFFLAVTRRISGTLRSVESIRRSLSLRRGRRFIERATGVFGFFVSASITGEFFTQARVWPMIRRISSETFAIFAIDSISVSVSLGLLITATAASLFGLRL